MVGLDAVRLTVRLLGAEAEEAVDGGATVRAVDPLVRGDEAELGGGAGLGEGGLGAEQRLDVHAVVDALGAVGGVVGDGHVGSVLLLSGPRCGAVVVDGHHADDPPPSKLGDDLEKP
ncbi:MAG: hypothetical protein R2697_19595 [Ilumatobacteraceae bacterium]